MDSEKQCEEENEALKNELQRMSSLLKTSQSEKNEIGLKYQVLSERLEAVLLLQVDELDSNENFEVERGRHQAEWRNNLLENLSESRNRLIQCQEQQNRQASVICQLQGKVDEYQRKCEKLEDDLKEQQAVKSALVVMDEDVRELPSTSQLDVITMETIIQQLEDSKHRCESLSEANSLLREQLESATLANQSLTRDVQRMTDEWQHMKQELKDREDVWREEEQSFSEYYTKEHHRLLKIWHNMLQFRQEFGEMKLATERDLSLIRTGLRQTAHNVTTACFTVYTNVPLQISDPVGWELQRKKQELVNLQLKYNSEQDDLQERVRDLTSQNDRRRTLLEEKEKVISTLNKTIEVLECSRSSSSSLVAPRSKDDLEVAHRCLKAIALCLTEEAQQHEVHVRHLKEILKASINASGSSDSPTTSGSSSVQQLSQTLPTLPVEYHSFTHFAEATLVTVQVTQSKRRLLVEELQTKLSKRQEEVKTLKLSLADAEEEQRKIQKQNSQLFTRLETLFQELHKYSRDKELFKSVLDDKSSERVLLEHTRQILNEQVDSLTADNEHLLTRLREIQNKLEISESDRETLRFQEKQLKEELNREMQQSLRLSEEETKLRSEVRSLTNNLKRINLDKDILQRDKADMSSKVFDLEERNSDLSKECESRRLEIMSLADNIQTIKNTNESLNLEKTDLVNSLSQLKEIKNSLNREKINLERERQRLRAALLSSDQRCTDQTEQILSLQGALQVAENTKQKVEADFSQLTNIKEELDSQISLVIHQCEQTSEQLSSCREEVSRLRQNTQRLEEEKESLAQDHSLVCVEKSSLEGELGELKDGLISLKAEKDHLEVALYAAQQACSALEKMKQDLTRELRDATGSLESLAAQMDDLRTQQEVDLAVHAKSKEFLSENLQHLEEEFSKNLHAEEEKWKKEVDRIQKEKETQRHMLIVERTESEKVWEEKQEELSSLHLVEMEKLIQEMESLKRECHQRLQAAQADKNKVESTWAQERFTYEQRLHSGQKALEEYQSQLSIIRREKEENAQHHSSLQEELKTQAANIRLQFNSSVSTYEQDLKEVRLELSDLQREREMAEVSATQLKVQLRALEQARDELCTQLAESNRKANEMEVQQLSLLKSVTTSEQRAAGEKAEKEMLLREGEDFRNQFKVSDSQKAELEKTLDKMRQKANASQENIRSLNVECSELKKSLKDVEHGRQLLKREAQHLQRDLTALRGELTTKTEELENQSALHLFAEQREADVRKETATLKQKLLESEAQREVFRKELLTVQRQSSEVEHRLRLQQESHKGALQESFSLHRKVEEHREELERNLHEANQECHDLRVKVKGLEGRSAALEAQLTKTEGNKQDLENRLWSLQSTLRYTLGIGLDGASGASTPNLGETLSPPQHSSPIRSSQQQQDLSDRGSGSKERSPVFSKGGSPVRSRGSPSPIRGQGWLTLDLDVDLVRNALQDLVHKVQGLEQEKGDWKRKSQSISQRLEETKEDQSTFQSRFLQLQKRTGDLENDKKNLELQLIQSRGSVKHQEQSLKQLEKERQQLQEKAATLETQLTTNSTRHTHLEEKLTQLKQAVTLGEKERRSLFEAKEKAESRVLKLELDCQSMEAELQRIQVQLADKETQNQLVQQRLTNTSQCLEVSEEKSQSLQRNLDKLTLTSHKSTEQEKELQEKVQSLTQVLNERTSSVQNFLEQQRRHRQELLKCEKERQTLQIQTEDQRQKLSENRQQNQSLQDKIFQLQKDLAQSESRRLELDTFSLTSNTVVARHQDGERTALQRVSQLQQENVALRDSLEGAKQQLAVAESQLKQLERSQWRLEKDRSNLEKSLYKVEKDRNRYEESSSKSKADKSDLGRSLSHLESENLDLQRKVQTLQVKLAELEQQHTQRLLELTKLKQQESYLEVERLRTSQRQTQQILEAKEATYGATVRSLEQKIKSLKEQQQQDIRRRSPYPQRHLLSTDSEISQLRSILDQSLRSVSEDPRLLESETRRLDTAIESHLVASPSLSLNTPSRLSKSPSPSRLTQGSLTVARNARRRLDKGFPMN